MPLPTRRRASKHEILVRDIEVTGVRASICVTAERAPDNVPHQTANARLVIVGDLVQPLNGQTRVELRLYATDAQLGNKDPPAFGVIVVGEGLARIGAFLRREHWADAWTMANAGAVKHCRISFTMPASGQGVVTRLDVSSDRVDD